MAIACLRSEIDNDENRKLAATFEKAKSANHFRLHGNGCPFMWGVYFHMGAYKHDEIVVIKMGVYSWGAYIVQVLIIPAYDKIALTTVATASSSAYLCRIRI